jgi:hypothetical protein
MPELEGPDEYITVRRAAQISGLSGDTLSRAGHTGRLQMVQVGWHRYTTRRMLHRYLMSRTEHGGPRKPLPPDYVAPE